MKYIVLTLILAGCGFEAKPVDSTPAEAAKTKGGSTKSETTEQGATTTVTTAEENPQSLAVASEAKLPACNDKREGTLANIRSEARFVVCEGGNWNSADMTVGAVAVDEEELGAHCAEGGQLIQSFLDKNGNGILDKGEATSGKPKYVCNGASGKDGVAGQGGAKGDQGDKGIKGDQGSQGVAGATGAAGATGGQGATGAVGAAGANGNDNHIKTIYTCTGSVYSNRFYSSTPAGLKSVYRVVVNSYGDVTAKAQIGWDDSGTDTAGWAGTFDSVYAASQAQAATARVDGFFNVVIGSNNSGTWTWTLNTTTSTATVVYSDPDLSAPTSITFTNSCTKANY